MTEVFLKKVCSQRKNIISFCYDIQAHLSKRHRSNICKTSMPLPYSYQGRGGSIIIFSITLTLLNECVFSWKTSSWNVSFPIIYLGRFWQKNVLKIFWSVFMSTPCSAPILLIYRLQDTTGCNINPSYYQNTTI